MFMGMVLLYLGTDCLIAFKSSLLAIFGTYIIMVIKFFMKEPRPFWETNDIKSTNCDLTFSSPDRHAFNLLFFWMYVNYQYLWKYSARPNKFLVGAIGSCIIVIYILSAFIQAYFGLNYIHQSLIGGMIALIYLAVCVIFDDEIM